VRPRVVPQASVRPQHCAIFRYIREDPDGFIDTGTNLNVHLNSSDRVYLSVKGLKEVVKLLDWPTPEQHAEATQTIEKLQREVSDLREQLKEADRELTAVEVFKQSPRWKEAKAPGRPRKVEA
jgi:hypothetical protein